MNRQKGFTLIGFVVAVILFGVIVTVLYIKISAYNASHPVVVATATPAPAASPAPSASPVEEFKTMYHARVSDGLIIGNPEKVKGTEVPCLGKKLTKLGDPDSGFKEWCFLSGETQYVVDIPLAPGTTHIPMPPKEEKP